MPAMFLKANPYADNVLTLPVKDIDVASSWYGENFAMTERSRASDPAQQVILERDGIQMGFAVNDGKPEEEGAAIEVDDIESLKSEFEARGVDVGNWRIDERDGKRFQVFFVVAPDGLCYYFYQGID